MKNILLTLHFLLTSLGVCAQVDSAAKKLFKDTVSLISGQQFIGEVVREDLGGLQFNYMKGKKEKSYFFDKYRVFSYQRNNQSEVVVYQQDSVFGSEYTEREMRAFMYGARDAREYNKPIMAFVTSFAISGVGSYYLHQSAVSMVMPIAGTLIVQIPRSKVSKKVKYKNFIHEEAYLQGYEAYARPKKWWYGLSGGLVGFATGLGAGFAFN